jgi:hypothetical protein
VCRHGPDFPWKNKPRELSELAVHEILNGPLRQKSLDQPQSLLVVCGWCNCHELTDKKLWPESRQLAVLLNTSPERYDLAAHNWVANERAPNRITQMEVEQWMTTL